MKHLALIVALAAFSTSAFAEGQYQDEEELRLVRVISVQVYDVVRGGCLSNPDALKTEAELVLRRSGFSIADTGFRLYLEPNGFEIGQRGWCLVALEVDLVRWVLTPEGHYALAIAYEKSVLFSGLSKPETQEYLRDTVSEFVSDLANEILKAQGK